MACWSRTRRRAPTRRCANWCSGCWSISCAACRTPPSPGTAPAGSRRRGHGTADRRLDRGRDRLWRDRAAPGPGLLLALEARVLVSDPLCRYRRRAAEQGVALPALLAQSDIVVCAAIANAETANLLNAETIGAMKSGAFLINISRGELLDDAALADALDRGHLAGAAARRRPRPTRCPPRAGQPGRRRDRHAAYRRADPRGGRPPGAGDGASGRGDPARRGARGRGQR